jgi:hypothetical protein
MDTGTLMDRAAFALGLLGSVLGIMATWRQMSADQVRLRVEARIAYVDGRIRLAVRVANLSAFAVTVQTIAFTGRRGLWFHFAADTLAGERLPQRLDARAELTVLVPPEAVDHPDFATVRRPVAQTACGEIRTGPTRGVQAYRHLRTAEQAVPAADDGGQDGP